MAYKMNPKSTTARKACSVKKTASPLKKLKETVKKGTKAGAAHQAQQGTTYSYKGEYYADKASWRKAIASDKKNKNA